MTVNQILKNLGESGWAPLGGNADHPFYLGVVNCHLKAFFDASSRDGAAPVVSIPHSSRTHLLSNAAVKNAELPE